MEDKLFLGLDLSTQQLKALVINESFEVVASQHVQYDQELPEFRTHGGVHESGGNRVTSPTLMWVKALDLVLDKIKITGVDFNQIVAVSGAGQQHGSVYWRTGAKEMLKKLEPDKFLHQQLAHAFSLMDSPVWMDSSTSKECQELEEAVGGKFKLAQITGAGAFERFTGNQIKKIWKEKPEVYLHTERISLVSSFLASLFLGDYATIDMSDAGGMNLFDLENKKWAESCVKQCGPNLGPKLGPNPVPSSSILGPISQYMVDRYGFSEDCQVVGFTGDNPSSLAGLGMQSGDVALTLGTSDVIFVWLNEYPKYLEEEDDSASSIGYGNVSVNPVDSSNYMALICWKNGSLTREKIRDEVAEGDWDIFNQLLDSTPRGNFGNLGMYYFHPEITPHISKSQNFRFNKVGDQVGKFASREVEVRAVIEGQILSKRVHAEHLGFSTSGGKSRILVTGGASVNNHILQVISDVFNSPVYTQDATSNSAAFGGCVRAIHGHLGGEKTLSCSEIWSKAGVSSTKIGDKTASGFILKCLPHSDAKSVYNPIVERYKKLEEQISKQ